MTNWVMGFMALVGAAGMVLVATHLLELESKLVEQTALNDAAEATKAITEFRTLYTSEVVNRVEDASVRFTFDYADHPGELPLPATLSILLGERMGQSHGGSIRLYSDHPFPGGSNSGRVLDAFQEEALVRLRANPADPVHRFVETEDGKVLRYATADIMREACVDCHNTHPDTPYDQWKTGDVRGVLEISRPHSAAVEQTRREIKAAVWLLVGTALVTLTVMGIGASRLRWARIQADALTQRALDAQADLKVESHRLQLSVDAQERIKRQLLQAQKLESLGLLSGGIAHDFNNLLVAIMGNAELAQIRLPEDSPAHGNIDTMMNAAERAAKLTSQLQAYAGEGTSQAQPTNLNEAVEAIVALLHTAIGRKANLGLDLDPKLPFIMADITQLERVVMNLCTNAAEAITDGIGQVRLRTQAVELAKEDLRDNVLGDDLPAGCYVLLEVSDDGCGMDAGTRAQMFDPFFSSKATGRGLGLSALLGITRNHKAAIFVDSQVDTGTTIRIFWPCADEAMGVREDAWTVEPTKPSGQLVLVVDDDEGTRTTTVDLLEALDFQVLSASSGESGVELLKQHMDKIFVVLMDMTMPGISGLEAHKIMNELQPGLRVVLFSGYTADQPGLKELLDAGHVRFLPKPFSMDRLVEVLLLDW
jgi:signal transduction histidine kinase/CheY-like chemotaxis protein